MAKSPSPPREKPPLLPRMELENRLPAVDPSPDVPVEPLEAPLDFFEELELREAEAPRSEKRFVEPRLAPRLAAAACAGAPPASEVSDEELLLALLDEVMVTVVGLELEPVDELEDEGPEEEDPPPPPPKTLAADDIEPREEPRLPLKLLRLPRNWGAITAANRSAVTTPLTLRVRFRSPAPTTAVRTAIPVGPPPSFGDRRSRLRYKPAPATIATASTPHIQFRGLPLGGMGLTISGLAGALCGSAPPKGLGRGALLI
ncbi:MAG TPA: hypothetical protein VL285_16135 [Bryobacteraceae bacterium]|nr:hypothetical protein [Bryobacteraceae bacterium]